ncbi:hypothetical protein POX_f07886 [Penicillium oxalicum]|uniref:Uncharacterized protein n=1 Tax=Penicillium oxalicum (strain 114-2 / CGMCC 5302) TaxID=933388 RepID=S7ZEW4_PENO1|nr:hypothetical protein POX_f07886 [Penicillium oxalicum]EPS28809.1 hypothetical protein PDE_03755 [Penicillium oxalicum 114-2]KAI2787517.1 hypothetical protein POX_f07886 [Penicillium oxalicum]
MYGASQGSTSRQRPQENIAQSAGLPGLSSADWGGLFNLSIPVEF